MKTAKKICSAIVTAAFVVIIASPLLVLAVRGAVEPYGRIPFTAFPPVEALSTSSSGAFDQLASALLERSQLKKTAITVRNTALLRIVRQYDHNNVASGKDGWLFWKDDWFGGECQKQYDVEMAVSRIGAMLDVAKASGIDMYFAIAPDKSTLYPEFLDPHFKKIWGCKQQSAELLRSAIRVEAPQIVDHLTALRSEKGNPAGNILYGKADTHWTNFGAAIAFRQLLAAMFRDTRAMSPPALTGKLAQPPADMETTMLLVGNGYPESEIDIPAEKKALASVAEFDQAKSTLVLHDSFYNKVIGLTDPFRHGAELNFDADPQEITKAVQASDRLVVSRVERAVVNSVLNFPLSWPNTLGKALVARDELAARECRDFAPASGSPRLQAMAADANGYLTTAPDPQMVATVPVSGGVGKIPCIRLRLTLKVPDTFEIFFSPHSGQDGAFVAGRSIQVPLDVGDHTIALVLPDYLAGRSIRIDPGDSGQQTTLRDVEFGWRAAHDEAAK
ncbi:hypothetical protein NL532_24565 [Mesorhizobium sp. C120A]|uniref:alginate O-acetyltransferase AlgX-related protein n=1 Tax=unclassified Mesorhizobium TaxID=325217 RepID=UPI0003D06644|nr:MULTISPECIES: hypothetical protein [unclassified Mesorhizobium]ESZ60700.1 hypothetical protein X728_15525 [Mesorhizobium sp. L103C120A0]WJI43781.1 hypothetical protein NL532_24565 [Mesorhizobium sp. C120A]